MSQKVRVRFAPSPTGPLHIGGVRTALFNYLYAKKHNGDMILRIEDTDQNRFVPGAEEYIVKSLEWVGIKFDEGVHVGGDCAPYRQSERKELYKQYADQLLQSGNAYYAFDTPEELEAMREKLKASGMSAQYDAASRMSMKNSLTLSDDDVKRRIENGENYVIRIKLPRKEEVKFYDLIRGWVAFNTAQMDDKVLFKSDGMPTYHLANVVDDYLMKITHVIRGEEWLPSAPLHVMLYRYLGWENVMPSFAHLPLILKPEGNGKLSKRDGDRLGFPVFPLEWKDPETNEVSSGYREVGYEPAAVVNMLALLGWHPSDNRELFNMDELIKEFTIEKISKNGAKFDIEKARWFNHQYLMSRDNQDIAKSLMAEIHARGWDKDVDFVEKVVGLMKEKVSYWKEIPEKGSFFFADPLRLDEQVIRKKWKDTAPEAMQLLNNAFEDMNDWNSIELEETYKTVLNNAGHNPGQWMQVLRVLVSGEPGGPPIFEMLELLGKEVVTRRIKKAIQQTPLSQ